MTIKDLVNLCGENNYLKEALLKFDDSDISIHNGKWDYETDYVDMEEEIREDRKYEDDYVEDEDEEIRYWTSLIYINKKGKKIYEPLSGWMNEFHGIYLGEYRIFLDEAEGVLVFKHSMLCDGVVDGFFTFKSYEMIDGELERTGEMKLPN